MSNAPTPTSVSTIEIGDGSATKSKRRLSDASEDSVTASKSKKLIGPDGNFVKDGSNKTKSGRFKPGAPIDLDEQCGVVTDKNVACSRSLTCKTHGVGAKRAVPGRSKGFDNLLAEFQKRKEQRLKLKAEREQNKEKQIKKAPSSVLDLDGDIAVPQSGSQTASGQQMSSPLMLNSIAAPQPPPMMDDISLHQSSLPHFQPIPQIQSQNDQQPYHHQQQQHQQSPSHSLIQQQPTASASGQPSTSSLKPGSAQPASSSGAQLGANGNNSQGDSATRTVQNTKAKSSQANNASAPVTGGTANQGTPNKNTSGATAGQSGPVSTKKKKAGEGGKASKGKASARNKADLILGEVDDPPEPANATSNTLIGADGNLIVEEEAPDSDDDIDQLMIAMTHSRARPLSLASYPPYERVPMKLARYRESFLTAFTGRTMSSATT